MKITSSPFVYRGVAVFMPEKVGNLQLRTSFLFVRTLAHLHFSSVRFEIGNNQNNFFLFVTHGALRLLGSSRFALTQPDRFATGVFLRGVLKPAGCCPP